MTDQLFLVVLAHITQPHPSNFRPNSHALGQQWAVRRMTAFLLSMLILSSLVSHMVYDILSFNKPVFDIFSVPDMAATFHVPTLMRIVRGRI